MSHKTNNLSEKRIGTTATMNNGLQCTIIDYRSCVDIDVQFEDGTICKNKDYYCFKKGDIKHPVIDSKVLQRINETRLLRNGMKATIIAYRNSKDIDILYEDGYLQEHQTYQSFINRRTHPLNEGPVALRDEYKTRVIGETRVMKNGEKATIIAYRKAKDIDVQFEDGTIVTNKEYQNFKNGRIRNSNNSAHYQKKQLRLGEKRIMNDGNTATIIAYRASNDIDVEFEDGTIRQHIWYSNFTKGQIKKNERQKIDNPPIGERRRMNNGMEAVIIQYRTYNDVDIQFEDGAINYHKGYYSFKKGEIGHPQKRFTAARFIQQRQNRLGENKRMNNGQIATIIAYRNSKDIDIQFEDGEIVTHKSYGNFQSGNVLNKKYNYSIHIGESNMMKNGMVATIIEYRASNDIDVEFEDGYINQHKTYKAFQYGEIGHPFKRKQRESYIRSKQIRERKGESGMMNNGQIATILAYRSSNDIDVEFEDGTIVQHKTYGNFKNGFIKNPNK